MQAVPIMIYSTNALMCQFIDRGHFKGSNNFITSLRAKLKAVTLGGHKNMTNIWSDIYAYIQREFEN